MLKGVFAYIFGAATLVLIPIWFELAYQRSDLVHFASMKRILLQNILVTPPVFGYLDPNLTGLIGLQLLYLVSSQHRLHWIFWLSQVPATGLAPVVSVLTRLAYFIGER
jgi:hypothetical protein